MRTLTNEELTTVAGGHGITIGDVASGNNVGNGNTVDAGHNSVSADGNVSGNSASVSASAGAGVTNNVMSTVDAVVRDVSGSIL
jgi:hypothetical protein